MGIWQILLLVVSYLLGSIPFGLIFAKVLSDKDIRKVGSGNIGTANIIRNVGLVAGVLTFLCDFLKGLIPVLLGLRYFDERIAFLAGLLSVMGHIFPIFLQFKGGKGVATAFGVMLGFNYVTALLSFVVFLVVILFVRISSVASLLATVSNLFFNLFISFNKNIVVLNVVLLILIFFRHRENIIRIMKGEEPRMWQRKG